MLTDYQDSCSRVSDFGLSWNCWSIVYLSSQDELCIPQLSCFGIQLRYTSRCSSPSLFVHPHHLNCVLLDPGSRCASPLSIDGVTFCVVTWLTSRISTVQVRQTVLDHYTAYVGKGHRLAELYSTKNTIRKSCRLDSGHLSPFYP